jgi:biotin-(acetyl-CoA carboxylase) ligase
MTKEEFNSLPLEARNFIQKNSGCLSCGNAEAKLTKGYALYLSHIKMSTFVLIGGGVNYSQDGQKGVLRAVQTADSPFEIKEKIKIAKLIHASNPELFSIFDEKAMDDLLKSLPKEKVVAVKTAKTKKEVVETPEVIEEVEAPATENEATDLL